MIIIGERVDLRGGVIQTRGTAETAGRIEHTDCAQWWVATVASYGDRGVRFPNCLNVLNVIRFDSRTKSAGRDLT